MQQTFKCFLPLVEMLMFEWQTMQKAFKPRPCTFLDGDILIFYIISLYPMLVLISFPCRCDVFLVDASKKI